MKKNINFYTLTELQEKSFDDTEFSSLLDNGELIYSIIYGMFKFMNIPITKEEVIDISSNKKWMYKYKWNWKEHDKFINELAKIIKHIYIYTDEKSIKSAQDLVYRYGFTVDDNNKHNINNHFKNICNYKII